MGSRDGRVMNPSLIEMMDKYSLPLKPLPETQVVAGFRITVP